MVSSASLKEESAFSGIGDAQGSTSGYQNLAEAEYVVAVYQYMRLIGYPAHKFRFLLYAAQCALIKDVLNLRCVPSPAFWEASLCGTAKSYAGQENDVILLSLPGQMAPRAFFL